MIFLALLAGAHLGLFAWHAARGQWLAGPGIVGAFALLGCATMVDGDDDDDGADEP